MPPQATPSASTTAVHASGGRIRAGRRRAEQPQRRRARRRSQMHQPRIIAHEERNSARGRPPLPAMSSRPDQVDRPRHRRQHRAPPCRARCVPGSGKHGHPGAGQALPQQPLGQQGTNRARPARSCRPSWPLDPRPMIGSTIRQQRGRKRPIRHPPSRQPATAPEPSPSVPARCVSRCPGRRPPCMIARRPPCMIARRRATQRQAERGAAQIDHKVPRRAHHAPPQQSASAGRARAFLDHDHPDPAAACAQTPRTATGPHATVNRAAGIPTSSK